MRPDHATTVDIMVDRATVRAKELLDLRAIRRRAQEALTAAEVLCGEVR